MKLRIDEQVIAELENRVNTEHQKDIAAIKRVLRLIRKNKLVPQTAVKRSPLATRAVSETGSVQAPAPVASPGHQNGEQIEDKILAVAEKFPGQFTFSDLVDALAVSYPDTKFDRAVVSAVIFENKGKGIRVVDRKSVV